MVKVSVIHISSKFRELIYLKIGNDGEKLIILPATMFKSLHNQTSATLIYLLGGGHSK